MPITRTVLVSLLDGDNAPYQNAVITTSLDRADYDTISLEDILPETQVFRSDANGDATLTLWPNARGNAGSRYRVTAMSTAGAVILDVWITVPDADGTLLVDIDEAMTCASDCDPVLVDPAVVEVEIAAAIAAHNAEANPHPQYATGGAQDTHSGRTDNPHGTTAAQVGADPAGTAAAATAAHEAAPNPHPQYGTGGAQDTHSGRVDNPHGVTAAQVGADAVGTAAAAVAAHEAAGNPHPQYSTGGAQDTHSGRVDNPHGVTAAQVGADPAGTGATEAAAAVAAHAAAGDPHPGYVLESTLGAANGTASLDAGAQLVLAQMRAEAMRFLGEHDCTGDVSPAAGVKKDVYLLTGSGTLALTNGNAVAGDFILYNGTAWIKFGSSGGGGGGGGEPAVCSTSLASPGLAGAFGTLAMDSVVGQTVSVTAAATGVQYGATGDTVRALPPVGERVIEYSMAVTGNWNYVAAGLINNSPTADAVWRWDPVNSLWRVVIAGAEQTNFAGSVTDRVAVGITPAGDAKLYHNGVLIHTAAGLFSADVDVRPVILATQPGSIGDTATVTAHTSYYGYSYGSANNWCGYAISGDTVPVHEAAANPHPQYATGGAQDTHSGRTDNPHGVNAAQVGADATGTAAAAVAAHEAAGDPHPGYVLESTVNQSDGVAGLGPSGKLYENTLPDFMLRDVGDVAIDHASALAVPTIPGIRRLTDAASGPDKLTLGDGTVVVPGDIIMFPWGGAATTDWRLLSEGKTRIIDITASTTITGEHKNALLRVNSASDITLTLPQASTEALHNGFGFGVVQVGAGAAIFAVQGAETLLIKAGLTKTNGVGAPAQVVRSGSTEWMVAGDLV